MKVLALVKQVPATASLSFSAEGTLLRAGVPTTHNPDDGAAVEVAIRWAEASGGTAAVASMGPAPAGEMLSELAAMGCAEAWHLVDDALAGADLFLTAKALAALARHVGADAVVTGAVAADGQSGAVPPAVAGLLGWRWAGAATSLEDAGESLVLRQRRGLGEVRIRVCAPAVVSCFKTAAEPRIPDVMAVLSAPAPEEISAADLGLTPDDLDWRSRIGVVAAAPVARERKRRIWAGAEHLPDLLRVLTSEGM